VLVCLDFLFALRFPVSFSSVVLAISVIAVFGQVFVAVLALVFVGIEFG
jgi:hypothetical protein